MKGNIHIFYVISLEVKSQIWTTVYRHQATFQLVAKFDSTPSWLEYMHRHRQTFNISSIKSRNLNVSRLVFQSSLLNSLKPDVKSRMEMQLEQRRQAMFQLHLSDRQFYCLLRWTYIRGLTVCLKEYVYVYTHIIRSEILFMCYIFLWMKMRRRGVSP